MIANMTTSKEYEEAVLGVPVQLWNRPAVGDLYGTAIRLVVRDDAGAVRGAWHCPTDGEGEAVRTERIMPYAAPWVDPGLHPAKQDRVVAALATALQKEVCRVDLPMSPDFHASPAFLFAGFELRHRHSRVLDNLDETTRRAAYLSSTRAHIRAARKELAVAEVGGARFDFDKAIVGQSTEALRLRTGAAVQLADTGAAMALNAVDRSGVVRGGIFVVQDRSRALAMHSWADRTQRGVASLLIDRAVDLCVDAWGVSVFDLEGSVLVGVDVFMSSFGARAHPYAQLRWDEDTPSDDPSETR